MPQLEYFLVADSYSVDQFTNRISIFNVVEQVQGPELPYQIGFSAISAWNAEPGDQDHDFQTMLVVHVPGQEQVIQVPANFQMTNPRHRILQTVQNVVVQQAGEMRVEVLLNGDHAATHRISILPPAEIPHE